MHEHVSNKLKRSEVRSTNIMQSKHISKIYTPNHFHGNSGKKKHTVDYQKIFNNIRQY